ncbi:hypothetical protein FJ945_11450 [Mesorhizobium sp. B2-4-9]|nr:hypothetical protein FJ550_18965 [Mesorhizobium sp. B2-5-2]TPL23858.1 hypothetical protein FJ946_17100 [Mesorhizobium sp. B2-4-7]TPL25929.1 hypothetical protein FJ945_11450 [Mesorhizobium sp. B2-4-9]TPL38565.1 hypothetical protein FJ961_19530 [Mesorhizobium sp. B2-4-5]TPM73715.1 hypothetical protein FJ968_15945 [Mesorhizobium sp. B2-1-6]TPN74733.1 hypothetical protein FJ985_21260 [Mesorhizobium sp. B1-1-2]
MARKTGPERPPRWCGITEPGFLAPTKVGERWLGEAETERGNGAAWICRENLHRRSPLSDRFGATSPALRGRGTHVL